MNIERLKSYLEQIQSEGDCDITDKQVIQLIELVTKEGWRFVPIQPTKQMIINASKEIETDEDTLVFIHQAMLEAAPLPEELK